jgi:hypothetical protein
VIYPNETKLEGDSCGFASIFDAIASTNPIENSTTKDPTQQRIGFY